MVKPNGNKNQIKEKNSIMHCTPLICKLLILFFDSTSHANIMYQTTNLSNVEAGKDLVSQQDSYKTISSIE